MSLDISQWSAMRWRDGRWWEWCLKCVKRVFCDELVCVCVCVSCMTVSTDLTMLYVIEIADQSMYSVYSGGNVWCGVCIYPVFSLFGTPVSVEPCGPSIAW